MNLERKFIPLAEVKADTDYPHGVVEGYAAVYGNLDEGGDIIVGPDACDNLKQFLETGWTAEGHAWGFSGVVGYPLEAAPLRIKQFDYQVHLILQLGSGPDAAMQAQFFVARVLVAPDLGGVQSEDQPRLEALLRRGFFNENEAKE